MMRKNGAIWCFNCCSLWLPFSCNQPRVKYSNIVHRIMYFDECHLHASTCNNFHSDLWQLISKKGVGQRDVCVICVLLKSLLIDLNGMHNCVRALLFLLVRIRNMYSSTAGHSSMNAVSVMKLILVEPGKVIHLFLYCCRV